MYALPNTPFSMILGHLHHCLGPTLTDRSDENLILRTNNPPCIVFKAAMAPQVTTALVVISRKPEVFVIVIILMTRVHQPTEAAASWLKYGKLPIFLDCIHIVIPLFR
jgi:hypothetical protein